MPSQPELLSQAYLYAQGSLGDLLNHTITDGIVITAALRPSDGRCLVGYGISATNLVPDLIPVKIGDKPPRCYLEISQALFLAEHDFLAVASSSYSVVLEPDRPALFHYDYIREPENEYPQAHFHVAGESKDLAALCERADRARNELGRFHFPVGGKRYRPSLEDVVEFLIVEGLAEPREGWEIAIEGHREEFHRMQLGAAVLADPDTARTALAIHDARQENVSDA